MKSKVFVIDKGVDSASGKAGEEGELSIKSGGCHQGLVQGAGDSEAFSVSEDGATGT